MHHSRCYAIACVMLWNTGADAADDWIRLNLDLLETRSHPSELTIFGPPHQPPFATRPGAAPGFSDRPAQPNPITTVGRPRPNAVTLSLQIRNQYPLGIVRLKLDRSMRIRGWELREKTYVGQTKIGNEWGVGVLFVREAYSWGVNNRGVSFIKRF